MNEDEAKRVAGAKLVELKLEKSPAMIAAGHGSVNAIVPQFWIDAGLVEHKWHLVYRWGTPKPGRKIAFAAQAKIKLRGKRILVQLHRFVMGAQNKAGKVFVIPKDGNALNCDILNLTMLTQAEWETRNHRNQRADYDLSDTEREWMESKTIALGLPRRAAFAAGIRELIQAEKAGRVINFVLAPKPATPAPAIEPAQAGEWD